MNAVDSLDNTSNVGNAAPQQSIAVSVVNGPVIAVPGAQLIGISKSAAITGVSVSENGASGTETFTATLADTPRRSGGDRVRWRAPSAVRAPTA